MIDDQEYEYEGENEDVSESQDAGSSFTGEGQERSVNDVIQEAQKKWKLQDGDYEEEVDEETLLNYARKARGADRRFQEAAERQKAAEMRAQQALNTARYLMANPEQAMREMGKSAEEIRAFAESIIKRELEEKLMTPEEKQAREEREAAKRWREYQEHQKKVQEAEQIRRAQEAQYKEVETGIGEALRNLGVLSDDQVENYSLAMEAIKFLMHDAHKAKETGKLTLSYEEAVKKAVYASHRRINSLLSGWTTEQTIKALGPERLKQIREYDLKHNRRQQVNQTLKPRQEQEKPRERQYIDPKSFSDLIRRGR